MYRQRMYSFVIYQLSGIQKGIQAGHAWMEYAKNHFSTPEFQQWINHDKTVIVLNGGNTNNDSETPGIINKIYYELTDLGVVSEAFYEPDLNGAMTAIAFLVDERVWDEEKYPRPFYGVSTGFRNTDNERSLEYAVKQTGLPKGVFLLREYLSQFKLASN